MANETQTTKTRKGETMTTALATITRQCRICGLENGSVRFRASKRQTLCVACNQTTPRKIGRGSFDRKYWGASFADVSEGTRSEFYSDYLVSCDTFPAYSESTTSTV